MSQIINGQGEHVVTFELSPDHYDVLRSIGKQQGLPPDAIAQNILQAWMINTWAEIKKDMLKSKSQKTDSDAARPRITLK